MFPDRRPQAPIEVVFDTHDGRENKAMTNEKGVFAFKARPATSFTRATLRIPRAGTTREIDLTSHLKDLHNNYMIAYSEDWNYVLDSINSIISNDTDIKYPGRVGNLYYERIYFPALVSGLTTGMEDALFTQIGSAFHSGYAEY